MLASYVIDVAYGFPKVTTEFAIPSVTLFPDTFTFIPLLLYTKSYIALDVVVPNPARFFTPSSSIEHTISIVLEVVPKEIIFLVSK